MKGRRVPPTETRRTPVRRPRDRKQQIAAAAARLFRERGFHNVSMADVAEAVEITAPALYRHFRNKQLLLGYVVREALGDLKKLADNAPDLATLLRQMSTVVSEDRGLAILWQREARHLPAEEREELSQYLITVVGGYAALIRAARPELPDGDGEFLAWAVLGCFGSLSGLRTVISRTRAAATMEHLATVVAHCRLGRPVEQAPEALPVAGMAGVIPVSRREQLLTEAIRLFDERGFQSVSTEDIGEAVSISGPSLYKHFPSKTDLLVAAVIRAGERRQARTTQALARATGPREALELLLHAYIDFARENGRLIGLLISELGQLPEEHRKQSLQVQRDYLALWQQLLDQAVPGGDPLQAKVRIRAVLAVVDNVSRTGRLATRTDVADRLAEIGTALLLDP
ncbi:TetR/AcrR family transcriptional regulator [Streptomyces sp. NPDC005236]|uniref:TetR/AcrR family transcriptional regulator n=1 Tax=Streptomyces sp. NPDC005236 TaxID=3157028 RepID=UPI0033BFA3D2